MMPLLAQTLADAAIGFVVGMLVAIVLALAFSLSRSVEMGVMPLALLLRSVPLVAIAPVIILITGRGTPASVAVIGSIVVLFPALASIMFGLSRASQGEPRPRARLRRRSRDAAAQGERSGSRCRRCSPRHGSRCRER